VLIKKEEIMKIIVLLGSVSLTMFLIFSSLAAPAAGLENEGIAKYSVVSPRGEKTNEMITMAPRLDTLEGKTICMIAGDAFKAEVTFPKIEELLKAKYPTAKIVPYSDMPYYEPGVYGSSPDPEREEVSAAIINKGCDAVISGNGG
jgi:hypothetical protein